MKDVKGKAGRIQDAVAYRIRAELVCCDIYQKVHDTAAKEENTPEPSEHALSRAIYAAVRDKTWHEMCYWAEASARIAEGRCPGYETDPSICQCSCAGCNHNCSAHVTTD